MDAPIAIDKSTLTPIVRRALDSPRAKIISWQVFQLHGGAGDLGEHLSAVYRIRGKAAVGEEQPDWSLILKVVGTTSKTVHPDEPRYWKREVMAFQSGHLETLPLQLRAPRYYGAEKKAGTLYWLWLEDLDRQEDRPWPPAQYGAVARQLGRFNGSFLNEGSLPDWDWMSRNWLRNLVQGAAAGIAALPQYRDHPLVRIMYPDHAVRQIQAFWESVPKILDALDRLPQTFCHRDAFPRNLFYTSNEKGKSQLRAIDWGYAGPGALGEEIAPLVSASLDFFEVDPGKAKQLDEIVFINYLTGLEESGWRGKPRPVRFAYAASSALIYTITYGAGMTPAMLVDESHHAWIENTWEMPLEKAVAGWAANEAFRLGLAEEVLELLNTI